ncbi:HD domain-containing protein [Flavobacterium buctense]|uniref:HD domain-containing protein n=1 Tax=Flavobacterium buctense TaxID=1648146 RepID=A0ABU9E008_9FLAO|nr:HD domain-containing protein [Flavobacterium buctense]
MKNWDALYTNVMGCLKEKLSPKLTYHHWKHTEHVVEMAEFIGHKEHCTEDEIILIKTAALFHDAGFVNPITDNHEDESIRYAQKRLPEYGYTKSDIEQIVGMINATKIPQNPQNKLERILADADLEYLGTDNFIYIGNKLYQELKHENPSLSTEEWNEIQIKFLESHVFHTHYCLHHRAEKKAQNLQALLHRK